MLKKPAFRTALFSLSRFFASRYFFYGIVGFFVLNAAWVAIASLYPMAFDENFHVGIIRLYAEVWSPFSVSLPADVNEYGAVTADPSFFFHYLMSFPYRFFELFTPNESVTIVLLRFINIAFFATSLFVYRKVLLASRITPAVTNIVMAIFVLIPVVPLLAGQVNYDNLLMLIVAAIFWYALQIRRALVSDTALVFMPTVWLVTLCVYGALIKYAFLPLAIGVVAVLLFEIVRAMKRNYAFFATKSVESMRKSSRMTLAVVLVVLGLGLVMFGQRYITNIVKYGDFAPDCAVVLSEERCMEYGPWGRNYRYRASKDGITTVSFPQYAVQEWAWGMWHRLYFTLAGPTNGYATRVQLPVPSMSAIVIVGIGALASLVYFRRLLRDHPLLMMTLLATVLYVGILIVRLYGSYLDTGRPVAINGRYLLPLLPLLGGLGGMAVLYGMRALGVQRFAGLIALTVLLLMSQGGGAFTYIFYAEPSWLWDVPWIQRTQEVLQPVMQMLVLSK